MDRIVYDALGDFAVESHADVLLQLRAFDDALRAGRTPVEAASCVRPQVRPVAETAAVHIRAFEAAVGEECGCEPRLGSASPLAGIIQARCIAVGNRHSRMFGREVAPLAERVALALESLLRALGATKTIAGIMD